MHDEVDRLAELSAMQRLHELVGRLLLKTDLDDALNEILDAAIEVTGANLGTLQLLDRQRPVLHIVADRGLGGQFLDYFREIELNHRSPCGQAGFLRERFIVEDILIDPLFERLRPLAAEIGIRAVQSTPLLSRNGDLLGGLSTQFRQAHRCTPLQLRTLDLYARQAADLIERQRSEDALRENEAKHVATLESIADGVFCFDADWRFTYVNQAAERLCEMSRAEMLGRKYAEVFPEAVGTQLEREYQRALETRTPVEFENFYEAWNRWFLVWVYPRGDGGFTVHFRDNTDRRCTEAALRQSEAKYRDLFESMTEAYCVIEMIFNDEGTPIDFLYLETNSAFDIQATRPMLGKRIKEIVPDFEQFWLDHYGRVALTGEPVRLEHIVKGLGDQWFQISAFRVGPAGSRKVGVLFENTT